MHKISTAISMYKYKIMSSVLNLIENDTLPPVIMCVGSNNTAGDSLGPIVGELLTHKYNIRTYVYGTVNRPLTAANVIEVYNFIKKSHAGKIFVIDASLGNESDNGTIQIFKGGISPAAAFFKNMPCMGDYSLIANVNIFSSQNVVALASVRLKSIKALAENIAFAINDAIVLQKAYRLSSFAI